MAWVIIFRIELEFASITTDSVGTAPKTTNNCIFQISRKDILHNASR